MLKTDSLEAYWRFEKNGKYLDFDGTDDYVSVPDNADYHFGSNDFTIGAWVYLDVSSISAHHTFVGLAGSDPAWSDTGFEFHFFMNSNGKLLFEWFNGTSTSTKVWSTNTVSMCLGWHYVTATRVSSTLTVYLDGESVGSGAISGSIPAVGGTPQLSFGRRRDNSLYLNGEIRNIRIYNGTGLTQTQIQNIMQSERLAPTTNLVGYWALDEGTGTTAYDDSDNSNNGTISGASWINRSVDSAGGKYSAKIVGTAIDPQTTNSKFGYQYENSGGTGYDIVPQGIDCGNYITISVWVHFTNSVRRTIYSNGSGSSGCISLEVSGTGGGYSVGTVIAGVFVAYTAANAIAYGTWTHVCYTRNGSGLNHKIYINGVEKTLSTNVSDSYLSPASNATSLIGARSESSQLWGGRMDELMIFNKALGLTDVKRLMMGLHPLAN